MLDRYDFIEAYTRYASIIRTMAASLGALDKFNVTITLAFMSLVAERMNSGEFSDWSAFLAANPDLLNKEVLSHWYSNDRLASTAARSQFLMPDLQQASG